MMDKTLSALYAELLCVCIESRDLFLCQALCNCTNIKVNQSNNQKTLLMDVLSVLKVTKCEFTTILANGSWLAGCLNQDTA